MQNISNNFSVNINNNRCVGFKGKTTPKAINNNLKQDSFESSVEKQKKKGLTKLQKWGIALGTTAALGVVAFYALRGRFNISKQLAEHIDFQEAKTIEEAIEFGKKHLGIKSYKGFGEKDLEVINWFNEGLVNTSNAMKGKLNGPNRIVYRSLGEIDTIAGVNRLGDFELNRDYFNSLDDLLNKAVAGYEKKLNKFDETQILSLKESLAKFKEGKISTLKDKLYLVRSLNYVDRQVNRGSIKKILEVMNDESARNVLIEKGIIQPDGKYKLFGTDILIDLTEDSLKGTDPHIREMITSELLSKSGYKFKYKEQTVFRTIYHELGHLQDSYTPYGKNTTGVQNFADKLKNWENKADFGTALEVSEYASTSPSEFVAEVFAELMSGNKLSDKVMELYAKYKGVIPKP